MRASGKSAAIRRAVQTIVDQPAAAPLGVLRGEIRSLLQHTVLALDARRKAVEAGLVRNSADFLDAIPSLSQGEERAVRMLLLIYRTAAEEPAQQGHGAGMTLTNVPMDTLRKLLQPSEAKVMEVKYVERETTGDGRGEEAACSEGSRQAGTTGAA